MFFYRKFWNTITLYSATLYHSMSTGLVWQGKSSGLDKYNTANVGLSDTREETVKELFSKIQEWEQKEWYLEHAS